VIAEGIEDERTLALVQDLHEHGVRGGRVHGAQGFLLGRPAPAAVPEPA
jgi:EAL domain-containing protein (putative c-di-GMP-specific phosphodiesterase class I)